MRSSSRLAVVLVSAAMLVWGCGGPNDNNQQGSTGNNGPAEVVPAPLTSLPVITDEASVERIEAGGEGMAMHAQVLEQAGQALGIGRVEPAGQFEHAFAQSRRK